MTTTTAAGVDTNPYVGPRAFLLGETLYGRDDELAQLVDLLIAERIVLFYSPSGAGKTSLIQAGLITRLTEEGFRVLPVLRVGLEPTSEAGAGAANRYRQSVLSRLEERLPPEEKPVGGDRPPKSLGEYLDRLPPRVQANKADQLLGGDGEARAESENVVLIFDHFEELLTLDPVDRPAKEEFLAEVGDALRNRRRWALFAMREDFVAGLDPYLHLIPSRLATTFRLDFLSEEAARLAIQCPAGDHEVAFSDAAATKLIDDLRQVRVQSPDGTVEQRPGPYIEPVHVQVVCRRLWERVAVENGAIGEADVQAVESVKGALSDYYDEKVEATAASTGVPSRVIRDWIETQMITEQGFRAQVLGGPKGTGEAGKQVVRLLENAYVVRADTRLGAMWYELAHDRLIGPVRDSNAAWREANLSTLERQAPVWASAGQPDDLLLTHEVLAEAEEWAARQSTPLRRVEQHFLATCQRFRAESERRERERRRRRVLFSLLILGLAGAIVIASSKSRERQRNELVTTGRIAAAKDLSDRTRGRQVLTAISELPTVKTLDAGRAGRDKACTDELKAQLDLYPRFHDFGVVNKHGRVLCIARPDEFIESGQPGFGDRNWFLRAKAHHGYAVGDFQIGKVTMCPTLTFSLFIPKERDFLVAFGSLYLSWLPKNEPDEPSNSCDARPFREPPERIR